MADALISIRPDLVGKIIAGEKKAEIRRRTLKMPPGTRLWIYSTRPVSGIEAVAEVRSIESGSRKEIWGKIKEEGGVSRSAYESYLDGSPVAFVIWLTAIKRVVPPVGLEVLRRTVPGFQPPQFFMWIPRDSPICQLLDQL